MSSKIEYYIVDAFSTGPFTGNQAAVIVTETALKSDVMQKIAAEFNLAGTAFAVPISPDDPSTYHLKWFTPDAEVKLCGHATLAATHVIHWLTQAEGMESITYHTLSGPLKAEKAGDGQIELDFPADDVVAIEDGDEWRAIEKAALKAMRGQGVGKAIHRGNLNLAIEVVMNPGVNLADLDADINALLGLSKRGVILTTETGNAEGPRFHARFLRPGSALLEDSITGSAHCMLGVIYSPRFHAVGKPLKASQGGPKRRGQITVLWDGKAGKEGGRMKLRGKALTVAKGQLFL